MSVRKANVCVVLVGVVVLSLVMVSLSSAEPNTAGKSDGARLLEVQEELLNVLGNSTRSVKNPGDLMAVLHSKTGQVIGRLMLEGIMLGSSQGDVGSLLNNFWIQLQGRLSPELQDQIKNYMDFFGGLELSTLPLIWEQMFQKDVLGNSLAEMPMGQLVDMLHPVASKYGIDLRAFLDSVTGKSKNNARELVLAAFQNLNITSLLSQFMNPPQNVNEVQTVESVSVAEGASKATGGKIKKDRGDETLRLFRPLVASMLREHKIDLEADAVLQVLSPLFNGDIMANAAPILNQLFNGDIMSNAAPLLSVLSLQAGDGLGPIISNILGGGEGKGRQEKMGGLLGGLGALLAGGGNKNKNMDLEVMMNMASAFMSARKPTARRSERIIERKDNSNNIREKPDMSALESLAKKLADNKNIDINALLEKAGDMLEQDSKLSDAVAAEKKKPEQRSDQTPSVENKSKRPHVVNDQKQSKKNNQITHISDLVEAILRELHTDKKGNRKVQEAFIFSKAFLASKTKNVGNLLDIVPNFASLFGMDVDKKFFERTSAFDKNAEMDWADKFYQLKAEENRDKLIEQVSPYITEIFIGLSSPVARNNLLAALSSRTRALLASYGLQGVTIDNFPERVGPAVTLMANSWNLPINPSKLLPPLRDYIKDMFTWTTDGLAHIGSQPSTEAKERVVKQSTKAALEVVVRVQEEISKAEMECLPLALCRINHGLQPRSLNAAVTRLASLLSTYYRINEKPDVSLLLKVVRATTGRVENCEETFGAECFALDEEEENSWHDREEL